MNIPTREELEVYRAVIGNNAATTHPILGVLPVKGCFPLPVTKTGTIATDHSGNSGSNGGKTVSGTGTLFLTELNQGDYLADENGICRRIKWIFSNTLLELEQKFPVNKYNSPVRLVKKNYYRNILVASTGTAAAILQEQTMEANDRTFDDGAPVSYDVSTASSELSFTLSV